MKRYRVTALIPVYDFVEADTPATAVRIAGSRLTQARAGTTHLPITIYSVDLDSEDPWKTLDGITRLKQWISKKLTRRSR